MVTVLEKYWKPESWFVVLLTVVAALAAVALATLLWSCLARSGTLAHWGWGGWMVGGLARHNNVLHT